MSFVSQPATTISAPSGDTEKCWWPHPLLHVPSLKKSVAVLSSSSVSTKPSKCSFLNLWLAQLGARRKFISRS